MVYLFSYISMNRVLSWLDVIETCSRMSFSYDSISNIRSMGRYNRQANLPVCPQCAVTSTLQCSAVYDTAPWIARQSGDCSLDCTAQSIVAYQRFIVATVLCYCVGNRDVTWAFPMNVHFLSTYVIEFRIFLLVLLPPICI